MCGVAIFDCGLRQLTWPCPMSSARISTMLGSGDSAAEAAQQATATRENASHMVRRIRTLLVNAAASSTQYWWWSHGDLRSTASAGSGDPRRASGLSTQY